MSMVNSAASVLEAAPDARVVLVGLSAVEAERSRRHAHEIDEVRQGVTGSVKGGGVEEIGPEESGG